MNCNIPTQRNSTQQGGRMTPTTNNKSDKCHKHNAKHMKANTKDNIPYYSISIKFKTKQN